MSARWKRAGLERSGRMFALGDDIFCSRLSAMRYLNIALLYLHAALKVRHTRWRFSYERSVIRGELRRSRTLPPIPLP